MLAERILGWLQAALLGLSALLCIAVSVCYYFRPDSCAAVTSLPVWIWLQPGLIFAALGWSRPRKRAVAAVVALWLLYLAVFAEEPKSLIRVGRWPAPNWQSARENGEALRVVSVNCAGGSIEAAAEVKPYDPDIVLLQETPEKEDVDALARELYGGDAGVAHGVDTDIIARGNVSPVPLKGLPPIAFIEAHVRLDSGIEAEVFSVHFLPPVVRFDVWSRSCWREHAEQSRTHREQAAELAAAVASSSHNRPIIVGGDFNVPGGDGALRVLAPRLRDTFWEGGRGWGDTVLNDMPVLRFDQIWVSEHFRALAVVARETEHSDHRMVICDLVARKPHLVSISD